MKMSEEHRLTISRAMMRKTWVHRVMIRNGYSVRKLATRLKLSPSMVSLILAGKRTMQPEVRQKILMLLGPDAIDHK